MNAQSENADFSEENLPLSLIDGGRSRNNSGAESIDRLHASEGLFRDEIQECLIRSGWQAEKEVLLPCGRADLIAFKPPVTMVIEVKLSEATGDLVRGLGQVLAYGFHFPGCNKFIATPVKPNLKMLLIMEHYGVQWFDPYLIGVAGQDWQEYRNSIEMLAESRQVDQIESYAATSLTREDVQARLDRAAEITSAALFSSKDIPAVQDWLVRLVASDAVAKAFRDLAIEQLKTGRSRWESVLAIAGLDRNKKRAPFRHEALKAYWMDFVQQINDADS